ncbi:26S proteasome non-ATPase regulatory subunit 4 homolog [Solanum verrucosum]|uniref:26S proteasome non-ATPase regulatory subunit 4 homolog n=1 Tax=Solanum verrucosum TaxID=315347 RepID=UPI0020D115EA|nr:26S proteasome non-ATPase regulatory subunit 4 homolog [Solanum verrucosum]
MVEEAVMICLDNSEWMRNGDYSRNRVKFEAQSDAVSFICGATIQANSESTVGALTMAGKGVRVLITPTSDFGEMLSCINGLNIGGEMNLAAGLQVAQLALKHRQNKKQHQRIILFAGSPVKEDKRVLEMIGRKLNKHRVALDVINFGQEDKRKAEKLEALVAAVNNNDNSHIIYIPPGARDLSDVLGRNPIFTRDVDSRKRFAAVASGAGSGYDFGVDPNLDPEIALALRVSMEEERDRQAAAAKKAAQEAAKQEKGEMQSTSQDVTMTENVSARKSETKNKAADLLDNDHSLLQQALAMSRDDSSSNTSTRDTDMSEADFEDRELLLDLLLFIQDNSKDETNVTELLENQSLVSSILASILGVDPNDPSIEVLLASMQSQSEQNHKNKEKRQDKEQKEDKK